MYIQKTNRNVIAAYMAIPVLNLGRFIQFDRMRGIQQQAIEKQRTATINDYSKALATIYTPVEQFRTPDGSGGCIWCVDQSARLQ
ncbi:MAG: hypothetical protein WC023_09790 [Rhodocyclaceae bacterium]